MTTENTTELQERETAGTDGNQGAASEERTFTQKEFDAKFRARYRREQEKHEREISELKEQHEREISELRETLTANIERAQHLQHDSYQVNKHREELEELRAYKAQRERQDTLKRISEEFGGVPVELLHGETEEELTESARALKEYADSFKPKVPEATPSFSKWNQEAYNGFLGDATKESITRIADRKERLKAIAEHADKFGVPGRDFDALGEFIE